MAKRVKTGQEFAQNWSKNLEGSEKKILAGVSAVTESPMEKAAASVDRWRAGVIKAADDGAFVDGLRSVSLDTWKRNFQTKGVQNLRTGIKSAEPKVVAFGNYWMPIQADLSQQVAAMPKGTMQDSLARVAKVMEANHARKGQFRKQRTI